MGLIGIALCTVLALVRDVIFKILTIVYAKKERKRINWHKHLSRKKHHVSKDGSSFVFK
jgi:hypothetical protein